MQRKGQFLTSCILVYIDIHIRFFYTIIKINVIKEHQPEVQLNRQCEIF